MNKELVSLTRGLVNAIESIHISLSMALSHCDTLATRQADVIAPLLFHIRQQRLFIRPYIQHPLVTNMAGIGSGTKAAFVQRAQPSLIAIHYTGFDFEHESAAFMRLSLNKVQQHGHRRRVRIVNDGAAWSIKIASTQDWSGSNKYQHRCAELSLPVHNP